MPGRAGDGRRCRHYLARQERFEVERRFREDGADLNVATQDADILGQRESTAGLSGSRSPIRSPGRFQALRQAPSASAGEPSEEKQSPSGRIPRLPRA